MADRVCPRARSTPFAVSPEYLPTRSPRRQALGWLHRSLSRRPRSQARGQAALRRLGNLLGGVEANWPVASTEESVDIERRRVFEPVAVDAARAGKMVTASYGEHHATRARQFPCECRERDYPRVESVTAYTASRSPVPSSRITSTDSSATGPSWLPADPRSPGPHGQSYPQTVDVQQCQPEARRPTRASDMRATRRLV